MGQFAFTVIALAFITALFLAWYFTFQARREERILLLEKGTDPSELPERGILNFSFSFPWLKLGILITCGSIGLLTGVVLAEYKVFGRGGEGGEPLLGMLIFGGIGLILAHYVGRSDDQT